MSSVFTNYGYWDGKINTTNGPDTFTVERHDFASRAAYEFKQAAEGAATYLGRMERSAAEAVLWNAEDAALEDLKGAASDCERAIARVIEQLAERKAARDVAAHRAAVAREAVL